MAEIFISICIISELLPHWRVGSLSVHGSQSACFSLKSSRINDEFCIILKFSEEIVCTEQLICIIIIPTEPALFHFLHSFLFAIAMESLNFMRWKKFIFSRVYVWIKIISVRDVFIFKLSLIKINVFFNAATELCLK